MCAELLCSKELTPFLHATMFSCTWDGKEGATRLAFANLRSLRLKMRTDAAFVP